MQCRVAGPDGKEIAVHGGSYGIGVSRLVGGIIEACHDDAGIVWPWAVAPFQIGVINLKPGDAETDDLSERLYAALTQKGLDVLSATSSIEQIDIVESVKGTPNASAARAALISPSPDCRPVKPTGARATGIDTFSPIILDRV